ncbi:paraquat-inducible protein A [Phaeobacter marinintestinus]|uniref:paraquat-inducible protein A n=1 Tax=Falsiphaeobacter marinintestinus TaxID=1492905 RepID=UPI0011B78388|nr:paraquat-inducible protein A [Phaeobacter marinintestinus]
MKPDEPLDLDSLIACPVCDLLHTDAVIPVGSQARCHRCHTVLMTPRSQAMTHIVMLATTSLILMVAAVFFPFLDVTAAGLERHSSVMDTILAFSTGLLMPLSFAVAALIVVLPTLRLVAILYTVTPMAIAYKPWPHAKAAFRLAESLQPWSMAEIFIVGVAVALVKIGGLATLKLGPAFWAFAALVIVTALKDTFMCKLTVWKTLEHRSPR